MEGTANLLVSYAISFADFVVIPMQGSQLDARQAGRQTIPFAVLFTHTSPAIQPRTQRHIEGRFAESDIPVLQTRLCDREAYRAIFPCGGTLSGLDGKNVSNLDVAIRNARAYAGEIVERLRQVKNVARAA